jgi:hypothetical protein
MTTWTIYYGDKIVTREAEKMVNDIDFILLYVGNDIVAFISKPCMVLDGIIESSTRIPIKDRE